MAGEIRETVALCLRFDALGNDGKTDRRLKETIACATATLPGFTRMFRTKA
jgi:hypothetical protein